MSVLASYVVVVWYQHARLPLTIPITFIQGHIFAEDGQTDRRNFNSIRDHTNGRPCTPVDELVNVYSVIQS